MTGTCAICNKAVQVGGHNHGVGIPGAPGAGGGPPATTPNGKVPPGLARYQAAKNKQKGKTS
jgi:hypothetical protein